MKDSFIISHGSIPSNIIEFSLNRKYEHHQEKLKKDYSLYRDTLLKKETNFFDDIMRDKSYLNQYKDLVRRIDFKLNLICRNYKDMLWVLSKENIKYYGIKIDYWGSNTESHDSIEDVNEIFPDSYIIYGTFGEEIFSIGPPGYGCISKGTQGR